jgi:hypothetical protein
MCAKSISPLGPRRQRLGQVPFREHVWVEQGADLGGVYREG